MATRLVIRLAEPASDLPARLARPAFCAVPVETPIVLHGVASPLPSAGPYYLAAHAGDAFVLKQNPNYHGNRPQRLDAIVYRTGVDVGKAISLMAQGKVDYVAEVDSALAPNTGPARAAGSRYRLTPDNWTERLVLNTRRPLFADARLRRAVAYALDRRTLAAGLGGVFAVPTSPVLAPNGPGSSSGAGYSLNGDPQHGPPAGRRQAPPRGVRHRRGRRGHRVRPDLRPSAARSARRDRHRRDGHPASADRRPGRAGRSARPRGHDAWSGKRRRDARPGRLPPLAAVLPGSRPARLERIATLASPRREAAAAALAAKLERDAVYRGIRRPHASRALSTRLGCVIDQPQYPGLDLAALCLRSD